MSKRSVAPAKLAGIRGWLAKRFRCFGGFTSYTPDFSGKGTDCLFVPDELSAKETWSRETRELLCLGLILALVGAGVIVWCAGLGGLAVAVSLVGGLFYLVTVLFRMYLSCASLIRGAEKRGEEEYAGVKSLTASGSLPLEKGEWPIYSVLVPLHHEVGAIPGLVKALKELDWPAEKLDVRFVVDEGDTETLMALRACAIPKQFRAVIVKNDPHVRSKPRALNAALRGALGEFVTIYDAEDRPEPDQLKKAWALFRKYPDVVCCQARLAIRNVGRKKKGNILTRWFAAEFFTWFRYTLPAIAASLFPVQWGGTSNHAKKSALMEVGGWDPYNMTEDCELGMRIFRRFGPGAVRMLNSTTWEEAPAKFGNWLRQRSRWIKGFFQTFLVHTRYPVQAVQEFGVRGFLGFLFFTFGGSVVHLVNLTFWSLFILWLCGRNDLIMPFFPPWVKGLHLFTFVVGNISLILMHMLVALREKRYVTAFASVFIPIYWGFMAIASVKAFAQLMLCPHYWEKTHHAGEDEI